MSNPRRCAGPRIARRAWSAVQRLGRLRALPGSGARLRERRKHRPAELSRGRRASCPAEPRPRGRSGAGAAPDGAAGGGGSSCRSSPRARRRRHLASPPRPTAPGQRVREGSGHCCHRRHRHEPPVAAPAARPARLPRRAPARGRPRRPR